MLLLLIIPSCLNFQLTKTNTWLWRWLPRRLLKHQSLTTVLLRTPITQMIIFNQGYYNCYAKIMKCNKKNKWTIIMVKNILIKCPSPWLTTAACTTAWNESSGTPSFPAWSLILPHKWNCSSRPPPQQVVWHLLRLQAHGCDLLPKWKSSEIPQ